MTTEEILAKARVWLPEDFKGEPYASRPQLLATLNSGEELFFWAPTYSGYASIRSSAYGYGKSRHKIFHTKRETADIIRVWREK